MAKNNMAANGQNLCRYGYVIWYNTCKCALLFHSSFFKLINKYIWPHTSILESPFEGQGQGHNKHGDHITHKHKDLPWVILI